MNKLKVKPIDIINAAIAEVYGKQAVVLLTLFSTLNNKGKEKIIDWTDDYSKLPRYTKTINLGEQSAKAQKGI